MSVPATRQSRDCEERPLNSESCIGMCVGVISLYRRKAPRGKFNKEPNEARDGYVDGEKEKKREARKRRMREEKKMK